VLPGTCLRRPQPGHAPGPFILYWSRPPCHPASASGSTFLGWGVGGARGMGQEGWGRGRCPNSLLTLLFAHLQIKLQLP
jgi:hypothetical protein